MKVKVDEETSLLQKDVLEGQWYIPHYRLEQIQSWQEGNSLIDIRRRILTFIRQKGKEALWATTFMGTQVYAYPNEEVHPVEVEREAP